MPKAYYNEFDPYAAQWLRNLIAAGHIAPGDVDSRSIEDVKPGDLTGYTQCHFFAGIGVWSYALRRAGWADCRPVWTGSCPCQPFSAAGKGNGFSDERHLWPAWFHLISQCLPNVIFGEQVASADGLGWLDLVQADLEAAGYTNGAVDLCAAGVGAPHIRQRLWIFAELADATINGRQWRGASETSDGGNTTRQRFERFRNAGGLADTDRYCNGRTERSGGAETGGISGGDRSTIISSGESGRTNDALCGMADSLFAGRPERGTISGDRQATGIGGIGSVADAPDGSRHGSQPRAIIGELSQGVGSMQTECRPTSPTNGYWRNADWLLCRDGKWRPVEPGTFPLAHGAPARVGRLRAYGNAIVAQAAEEIIRAYMECRP